MKAAFASRRWTTARFRFVRPDGEAVRYRPPPAAASRSIGTQLPLHHDRADIHINRHTAVTRWRGERMDYGMAVDALLVRAHRARANDIPAGTS